jgi:hypothetical protein
MDAVGGGLLYYIFKKLYSLKKGKEVIFLKGLTPGMEIRPLLYKLFRQISISTIPPYFF